MANFIHCIVVLWISSTVVFSLSTLCEEHETIILCTKIRGVGCCVRKVGSDDGLDNSEDDPDTPTDFKVKVLENEESFPQLNITWAAPKSGSSIRSLTGFRVKIIGDSYVIRFNTSLKDSVLHHATDNFFNFTSDPVEYQSEPVEVQITILPIPLRLFSWKQVNVYVNLTRNTEINYDINTNNSQKCEIKVRVKDKYIGSCNNVRLMKCIDPKCTEYQFSSDGNVFSPIEWINFAVNDVPASYYILIKPSAIRNSICTTLEKKGTDNRTDHFQIKGNTSLCYIFDITTMTAGDHPVTAASIFNGNDPTNGEVSTVDGSNDMLRKTLAPTLTSLGLIIGIFAVIIYILVRTKWRRTRQPADYAEDSKKDSNQDLKKDYQNCSPNLDLPSSPNIMTPQENINIHIEDNSKARILKYNITATHVTVEWIPLVDNERVTTYVVFLYDSQKNRPIGEAEMKHTDKEILRICLPIEEDVEVVHCALVTLFSDGTHQSTYTDTFTVPRPVEVHEKKILLIYSVGCECHKETVKQFARLLASSKCHVMFDQWDGEVSVDRRRWYENCLQAAHKVIIIHSENTYHKYEAYIQKKRMDDSCSSILGDTFRLALDIVLSLLDPMSNKCEDFRAKLRHVHFSYTKSKYIRKSSPLINRAAIYCIMKHVKELILSIHDLQVCSQTSDYDLPGLDQTAMDRLQKAIESATGYMNSDPSWHLKCCGCSTNSTSNATQACVSLDDIPACFSYNHHPCTMTQNLQPLNIAISEQYLDNFNTNDTAPLRNALRSKSVIMLDSMSTSEVPFYPIDFHPPEIWSDSDSQSDQC